MFKIIIRNAHTKEIEITNVTETREQAKRWVFNDQIRLGEENYTYETVEINENDEEILTQDEIVTIEKLIIETYKVEKGENFRMSYVTEYVIPMVKKFINKEVKNLDELKISGYAPIWDTRNNIVIKKILEQLLNIKHTGVTKNDKVALQNYLE